MDIDASQSHPITYQALDFLEKQVVVATLDHEEAVVSRLPQNVSDQELRALLGMTFVPYLNEEK